MCPDESSSGKEGYLYRASSGEQVEDEHDNSENQEEMNPTSKCVAADQTNKPQYEQNDRDRPKHGFNLLTGPAIKSAIGL